MALFDEISKRLASTERAGGPQVGQSQIEDVLRAKKGRAAGPQGPAATGLAAQATEQQPDALAGRLAGAQLGAAAEAQKAQQGIQARGLEQQAQLGREQLATQGQITHDQLKASEEQARSRRTAEENMKLDSIQNTATQKLRELTSQRGLALDDMFQGFRQSNQELAFRKDAAELEQLGFTLAMSDRAYLDELNRVGRERQLTNDLRFREEMANLTFGAETAALADDLGFMEELNASNRIWEKELTKLSSGDKLDLARAMIQDSNRRQMWTGVGNIATAGLEYNEAKEKEKKKDV
jgi:hypothetical protein